MNQVSNTLRDSGTANSLKCNAVRSFSDPALVRRRNDDFQDIHYIMAELFAQQGEFAPFVKGGYDPVCVYARAEHFDLKFERTHPGVVFR